MIANLHLHSRYSDGTLWPHDLAAMGKRLGLETIALTDHDTLGGSGEMLATAAALGMVPVPGCEIDCVFPEIGYASELLAYFPDGRFFHTQHFLRDISRRRIARVQAWMRRARELWGAAAGDFEDLARFKLGARYGSIDLDDLSFSRLDVFMYFKERGLAPRSLLYREFRKEFFAEGLLREERFPKPHARDVVDAVNADGGWVVLPHIGHDFDDDYEAMSAGRKRLEYLLKRFYDIGVRGVELYYYRTENDGAMNRLVFKFADPLDYFFTYGSDCHGPGSERFTIEEFNGRFEGFPRKHSREGQAYGSGLAKPFVKP